MLLAPESCSLNCSPAELLLRTGYIPATAAILQRGRGKKKKKLITSMTLTQPYLLQLSLCSWLLAKHKPELALQKMKRRPRNTMQPAVSVTPSEETISAPGSTESSGQGMLLPARIHLVARHQVRAKRTGWQAAVPVFPVSSNWAKIMTLES